MALLQESWPAVAALAVVVAVEGVAAVDTVTEAAWAPLMPLDAIVFFEVASAGTAVLHEHHRSRAPPLGVDASIFPLASCF